MKLALAPDALSLSRQFAVLQGCSSEELAALEASLTCRTYAEDQMLYTAGSEPVGLYLLLRGWVKVSRWSDDGKEQIVRLAQAGHALGYRCLMANTPHANSAVALEETTLCLIERTTLRRVLASSPRLANALGTLLAADLATAEARMLQLTYKPVRARLAEALLQLLRTNQHATREPNTLVISRDNLAALVGTTKETLCRLLTSMKDLGMLTTERQGIRVLKPATLGELAAVAE
ncbi:Crp/Fnr family transcriptional regulator [Solirubrum puertoriconensis]|uniref:Crp/Fnr family transcriptional regulator n=1 Tax=Solirubrum puertoriconensis TaxID=1751427 RepID=A0A9X0HJV9_SOLP1|nr:Crp/Fnr family transcriptional regulator [Solirubrum puertoriconensis]KUG07289.1 hypothetical protein ASU33_13075 [Solirubrum puertoriconensis]